MIRRLLHLVLVFALVLIGAPSRQPIPEARAVAPAAAAAPAAIVLLEGLILAVAAAAAIGVINSQQQARHTAALEADIASIKRAIREGLEATGRLVNQALARAMTINSTLGVFAVACPALLSMATRSESSSASDSRAPSSTRSSAVGECDPNLRDSPFSCCPDFMRRFNTNDRMSQVGRFAYRVQYWTRHNVLRQCCFEWDSMHGRFEVYERGNHQPVNHKGEKACAREEDLDEDMCHATFPEKADLLSRRHAPRNGCP